MVGTPVTLITTGTTCESMESNAYVSRCPNTLDARPVNGCLQ